MRISSILAAFCLFSIVAVQAHAQNPIAFGPYIQNLTTEQATICWSTYGNTVDLTGSDDTQTLRLYNNHEITLANLNADSEYSYDVLKDGTGYGKGTFRTLPEEIRPFSFVAYGDTRSDHNIHRRIVEHTLKEDPLLVINTGDLVSDGLNIADWEHFFDINRELMRTRPYYPVLGNHEHDADYYFRFFDLPGNERYYEFTVGDVLFLMLDSEGSDFAKPEYVKDEDYFWNTYQKAYFEKQKAWADHVLEMHKDAGFIFVFFHQPLISIKRTRVEDAKYRRKFWGDIFERHNVQALIMGHDHHYHRAEANGVQMITSGGGGAGLYDGDTPAPETKKYVKVNHYIRVDVGKKKATLKAVDVDGNEIETITIDRRN